MTMLLINALQQRVKALELPFKLPYIYLMDHDAIEDEILSLLEHNGHKIRLPEKELRKRLSHVLYENKDADEYLEKGI